MEVVDPPTKGGYRLDGGRLRLVIEDDQPPWCPEFDGQVRVSSLQTIRAT